MANTVKIKYSNTPGATPAPGSLVLGQIAINVVDKKLFWFDGTTIQSFTLAGTIPTITAGTAAPTGGSDGDIYLQYTP